MFNRRNQDVPLHMSVDNQMSMSGLESLHVLAAYGELIGGDKSKKSVNRRCSKMRTAAGGRTTTPAGGAIQHGLQ